MWIRRCWLCFKGLFSLVVLTAALYVAFGPQGSEPRLQAVGSGAMLLIFATSVWVPFDRPTRAGGLVLGLVAATVALSAFSQAVVSAYPKQCTNDRGASVCEFLNMLFAQFGLTGIRATLFAVSIAIFWVATYVYRRAQTSA